MNQKRERGGKGTKKNQSINKKSTYVHMSAAVAERPERLLEGEEDQPGAMCLKIVFVKLFLLRTAHSFFC